MAGVRKSVVPTKHKIHFIVPALFVALATIFLSFPAIVKATDVNEEFIKAAAKGHLQEVRLLLEKGADVNYKDRKGSTALMYANGLGHQEVVNLLKAHGAKE